MRIGIIGGTGREGRGIAMRWARAGHEVVVGSRDAARAAEKAREMCAEAGEAAVITGGTNEEAARAGEVALLTVPYLGDMTARPSRQRRPKPRRQAVQRQHRSPGWLLQSTAV